MSWLKSLRAAWSFLFPERRDMDLTNDVVTDDPDSFYVSLIIFGKDRFLKIGTGTIKITEEQEDKIRYFFENT